MGFLSKLYETVRVNSTLVDHPNDNEIYNSSTQTIGSGNETADVDTVTADQADVATQDGLKITPAFDFEASFSGGQTRAEFSAGLGPGDIFFVTAVPNNDPGNDHGYTVNKIWWDDEADVSQVSITETENAGGGQARIIFWEVNV